MKTRTQFLAWKRKNISLRGVQELGKENGVFGSFGTGLYTAFLSNKVLANQYGNVYFVLGGKPLNPLKFQGWNAAEIYRQNFDNWEDMKTDILKKGFDGIAIQGREYCKYKEINPLYFKTEKELFEYYINL